MATGAQASRKSTPTDEAPKGSASEKVGSTKAPSNAAIAFLTGYYSVGTETPLTRSIVALGAAEGCYGGNPDVEPWQMSQFLESKGELEGLYGNIYQRRDRLWLKYDKRIRQWTARLALDIPVDSLVADILNHTSLEISEASSNQRADIKDIVTLALIDMLHKYADLNSEARFLAAAALAEGSALGATTAAAFIANKNGQPVPDLDAAQREIVAQLQQSTAFYDHADTTVDDMINGLAGDIALGLPSRAMNGTDLHDYIVRTIGAGAGAAFYLDSAVHAAFALAILASIMAQGPGALVDFVTVGDEKVCPSCYDAEDGNPWKPGDVPPIPNHGGCRCWYAPAQ